MDKDMNEWLNSSGPEDSRFNTEYVNYTFKKLMEENYPEVEKNSDEYREMLNEFIDKWKSFLVDGHINRIVDWIESLDKVDFSNSMDWLKEEGRMKLGMIQSILASKLVEAFGINEEQITIDNRTEVVELINDYTRVLCWLRMNPAQVQNKIISI